MIDQFIQTITQFLLDVFREPRIVVMLVAILPIVEARLAIPIAFSYGLNPFEAWLFGFLGSSLIVPLLLLVLIPFIRFLSRTRLFKKIGTVLYDKFESKTKSFQHAPEVQSDTKYFNKRDVKKMLGVFTFVAIPLPLTGVWTGSAVASIIKLSFSKSLIAVLSGNLAASGIITLLSYFFKDYINTIILIISIIAIVIVVLLILKIIFSKPKAMNNGEPLQSDGSSIPSSDLKDGDEPCTQDLKVENRGLLNDDVSEQKAAAPSEALSDPIIPDDGAPNSNPTKKHR